MKKYIYIYIYIYLYIYTHIYIFFNKEYYVLCIMYYFNPNILF